MSVVSIKDKVFFDLYVGRETKYLKGSKWQNPYSEFYHSPQKCLDLFDEYFWNSPELYNNVQELKGMTLACWCKPKPCHADLLCFLANLPEDELAKTIEDNTFRYKKRGEERKKEHEKIMAERSARGYKTGDELPSRRVETTLLQRQNGLDGEEENKKKYSFPSAWIGMGIGQEKVEEKKEEEEEEEGEDEVDLYANQECPQAQEMPSLCDL